MALEVLRERPDLSEFTPLSTHQEATPSSFYNSKPVLHYHSPSTLQLTSSALTHPAFAQLSPSSTSSAPPTNGLSNGSPEDQISIPVEAYITSSNLILWSSSSSTGIRIPYPLISLHAQQGNSLYMQLILSDAKNTADEDLETLEVLLTPDTSTNTSDEQAESAQSGINGRIQTPAQRLFAAVSACADLHPDPSSEDEDEGGVDYENAAPGAGGWITAENMSQFMDEDGNFRVPEQVDDGGAVVGTEIGEEGQEEGLERGLGMGAGRVRRAEEFADAEEVEVDGEDEAKWRRTG